MSRLSCYCLATCCVLLLFHGTKAIGQGKRVLALLDDTALKNTHSLFFNSLSSRGYQITYSAANAPGLAIKDWDVYLYDKIIVFASNIPGITVQLSTDTGSVLALLLIVCCRFWWSS